jgi:N-acetylglutamate synthase-like GNAT family acetyltransferase
VTNRVKEYDMKFKEYTSLNYNDCLELFELNCPSFFAEEERDDYKQYLKFNSDRYLLGYKENSIVCCFGIGNNSEGISCLRWIMVHPNFYNRGYGNAMMSYLMNHVIDKAQKKILISTSQHTEAFFSKYGATKLNFIKDGWGKAMHRIDMEVTL